MVHYGSGRGRTFESGVVNIHFKIYLFYITNSLYIFIVYIIVLYLWKYTFKMYFITCIHMYSSNTLQNIFLKALHVSRKLE